MSILQNLMMRIRRFRQRLNRRLWVRRLDTLINLTERQMKSLWKQESLTNMLMETPEGEAKEILKELTTENLNSPLGIRLLENKQIQPILEDLQLASMQLTSMLKSNNS